MFERLFRRNGGGGGGRKTKVPVETTRQRLDRLFREAREESEREYQRGANEVERVKALGLDTGALVRFTADYVDEEREFAAKAGQTAHVVMLFNWGEDVSIEFEGKDLPRKLVKFQEDKLEIVEPGWGLDKAVPSDTAEIERLLATQPGFELVDKNHLLFEADGRRYSVEVRAWDVTNSPFYDKVGFKKRIAIHRKMFPTLGRIYIGDQTPPGES